MAKSRFRLSKETLQVEMVDLRKRLTELCEMTHRQLMEEFKVVYPHDVELKVVDASMSELIRRLMMNAMYRVDAIFDL